MARRKVLLRYFLHCYRSVKTASAPTLPSNAYAATWWWFPPFVSWLLPTVFLCLLGYTNICWKKIINTFCSYIFRLRNISMLKTQSSTILSMDLSTTWRRSYSRQQNYLCFWDNPIKKKKKNSYLMQFYEINICQIMIYRLYTVYKKHQMTKIGNQAKENSKVSSQVCCWQ